MRRVLYISNIEVPYRSEFFNQLSKEVELTVLYERKKSSNRNQNWTNSVKANYNIKYLGGIKCKREYSFSIRIIKEVFSKKYDDVIIGCYNSPSQMLAITLLKLFRKKYVLNLDGDYDIDGKSIKKKIKRFFVKGASKYLVAGEIVAKKLSKYVDEEKIHTYYFSSLTQKELEDNSKRINKNTNNKVLVVGQYFEYKGLDIALDIASFNQDIKYLFVGSGARSGLLEQEIKKRGLCNVDVIPFLNKNELYEEYQKCKCLLLSSRKECWGLVVNEAASFGCPIVASSGSGAAVEFVPNDYIFDTCNSEQAYMIIKRLGENEKTNIRQELIDKSKKYCIENGVKQTAAMLKENEKNGER